MLQPSCAPSCGPHGSISALNQAHTKPRLRKRSFLCRGQSKTAVLWPPSQADETKPKPFFFSSFILARRVQWGWPILCWIPGCCGMLTCSARAAAVCAGGGSSPFPARGRGKTAHVSSTSQDIKCAVAGWKLALGAPFLRHRAAPGSCSPLSEWMG